MKIKLLTHTDLDGIGCAIVAYMAFGMENVNVDYCDYKNIDKKIMALGSDGELYNSYDKIFITDISMSAELAADMDICCNHDKIKLLDHHATALDLNKYEWCDVRVTDKCSGIKHSGTELLFMYLHNYGYFDDMTFYIKDNLCRFVEIVRDYDTWRWKEELGEEGLVCKQVNDIFHIYGRDKFINWSISKIQDRLGRPYPNFDSMDKFILEQKQKDIDDYIAMKNNQMTIVNDKFGYICGVVFAERYFSELGNRLSELNPELDYIAMVDIGFGGVSYRTVRDDIDLGGEIAHSFGGGGHRKAAGSTFDAGRVRELALNDIFGVVMTN